MSTETTGGTYASYEAGPGRWHYHPTDSDWLAFNENADFSRAYDSEAEALADAEMREEMDGAGFDGVILDPETGRPCP